MENEILYKFSRLNLSQFAIFCENISDPMSLDCSDTFSFIYRPEENAIICILTVILSDRGSTILKGVLESTFHLKASSIAAMTEAGALTLAPRLAAQFASLTYGSMRGVIYARTVDTPLNQIVLPPCDLNEVFISPIKIDKT